MSEAKWAHLMRAPGARDGSPKYLQLRDILLGGIERGLWAPGAKLPTEAALTRVGPFSLGTVQRALRALVDQGVVVRQQGSGTFVAERSRAMEDPLHCRFLGEHGAQLPIYSKVISRKIVTERGPWSDFLSRGGASVIRIDRLIDVNHEFAIYSRFCVRADMFGAIMAKPLSALDSANLKIILGREFNAPIARLSQTLEVIALPAEACRALGRKKAITGTRLEINARTVRDKPLYFIEMFIPPNPRKLVLSEAMPVSVHL